jgi:hypothetical protein
MVEKSERGADCYGPALESFIKKLELSAVCIILLSCCRKEMNEKEEKRFVCCKEKIREKSKE